MIASLKSKISQTSALEWVRYVLCVNLIFQFSLSPRLWGYGARYFPKISIFGAQNLDFNFYLLLIPSLILMCFGRWRKWHDLFFLLLITCAISLDINRLQVWMWQQILMILFGFVLSSTTHQRLYLQWILVAVYLWSGIHKLNPMFAEHTFKWFLEASVFKSLGLIPSLGYVAAGFEILIGICLFVPQFRNLGCHFALLFHAFILYCLGPMAHDWNVVVWPWNIAMIAWVYLLFYKNNNVLIVYNQSIKEKIISYILIILVFINPFLHYFSAWDEQLSFKMYAGDCMQATLYVEPRDSEVLPDFIREEVYVPAQDSLSDKIRVVLDDWAFAELHVPPYYNSYSVHQFVQHFKPSVIYKNKCGIELLQYDWFDRWKEKVKIVDQ